MNNTTGQTPGITTTSGAADLLDLIEAYAEARHRQGHSSYNAQTAAARKAVKDALAAGQATAAPAQPEAQQGAAYAEMPEKYYLAGGEVPTWDAKQMHAFADATHTLRASHGQAPAWAAQADSVPAVSDLPPLPAPDLRDVGTKPQEIKEFLKGYATEYARTAIAARAQADSVQEDAARKQGEKQ